MNAMRRRARSSYAPLFFADRDKAAYCIAPDRNIANFFDSFGQFRRRKGSTVQRQDECVVDSEGTAMVQ